MSTENNAAAPVLQSWRANTVCCGTCNNWKYCGAGCTGECQIRIPVPVLVPAYFNIAVPSGSTSAHWGSECLCWEPKPGHDGVYRITRDQLSACKLNVVRKIVESHSAHETAVVLLNGLAAQREEWTKS